MKKERVIRIHFTGRNSLQLHGEHVPNFLEAYKNSILVGDGYFFSEGIDKILINMSEVTFIEETDIEIEEKKDVSF